MEYVYAALLLHKLGKAVNAENITSVMKFAGAEVDESKVKSLVASLKNIDIEKELESAIVASAPVSSGKAEAHSEEAPKEEKKSEEASAAGLSALFG